MCAGLRCAYRFFMRESLCPWTSATSCRSAPFIRSHDAGYASNRREIAGYLGQPVSLAQRWAKDGMPVRKVGRYVTASREELARWLGLQIGQEDLRHVPLHERKARLRGIIRPRPARLLYVDHVEERGEELFALACDHDLEGIVAKHKFSPYIVSGGETPWLKIKNPHHSQIIGREELFERERAANPIETLWDACALACDHAGV